jgi:hypothetical protein
LFGVIEAKNFDQSTTESTAVVTALCRRETGTPWLQIRGAADVFAPADRESPGMMRRPRDADPFIGDNIDMVAGRRGKAMARIDAQIHFMMSISNIERLRQFPGAGAKPAFIVNAAPFLHQFDSAQRLHRAN